MSEPIVHLSGLTRSFEQGGVRIDVLRGVSLPLALRLMTVPPITRFTPSAPAVISAQSIWAPGDRSRDDSSTTGRARLRS